MSEKPTSEDELKTLRFNMFMTPSEMAAIEEWAWRNRIRSKSEAVRRLCQMGLQADGRLADILREADEAVLRCHDVLAVIKDMDVGQMSAEDVAAVLGDALIGIMLPVMDASQEAHGLAQEFKTISETADAKLGPAEAARQLAEHREGYASLFAANEGSREAADEAFARRFRKEQDK